MLLEEAGELGRERVARRDVGLLAQGVAPALELLHVGLGLLVLRHGLADLALVRLGGALELVEVERAPRSAPRRQRERGLGLAASEA